MRRLGYYAIGIAVGLMLLGMFQAKKQMAIRAQEAEARELERGAESTNPEPLGDKTP